MVQAEPQYEAQEDGRGAYDFIPHFSIPENENIGMNERCCWNEYEDGHLNVKILYSGETGYIKVNPDNKPWAIFNVWGADDMGMEICQEVENDKEFNKLLSSWLEIYHEMPKYLTVQWCLDHGFTYA